MKKTIATMLSVMILAGILPFAALAEGETDAIEAPAAATEAPAASAEPVIAEPVIVEPATVEPATVEPVVEPVVEPETVEPETVETADETETAAETFEGRLHAELVNPEPVHAGDTVTLRASVSDANMDYTLVWEKLDTTDPEAEWKEVSGSPRIEFEATETTPDFTWRVRVTAEDGTVLTGAPIRVTLAAGETEEAEENEENEEIEEIEETEEPAEEVAEEPREHEDALETAAEDEEEEESGDEPDPEQAGEEEIVGIDDYEAPLGAVEAETVVLAPRDNGRFETVNVREEANGMSAIFATLPEGAEVTVLGVEGDWYVVLADGRVGYVYREDLAAYTGRPEEEAAPEMKVLIFSSRRSVMEEGEEVKLTSQLVGIDGYEITYQWECNRHDGLGWQSLEGANEGSYEFAAGADTLSWDWRLTVYLN